MHIEMNNDDVKKFCIELYDKAFDAHLELLSSSISHLTESKLKEVEVSAQKLLNKQ